MNIIRKFLGLEADPRDAMIPLWHQLVSVARDPHWYAECKVADSVDGRFDMITAVLSVVLIRLEASDELRGESARLTELFVEDMDGQLREFGVNDVVVGKRMGKLMSVMGGRLGVYRPAFNTGDEGKLLAAIQRNMTFAEGGNAVCVKNKLLELSQILTNMDDASLMKAEETIAL